MPKNATLEIQRVKLASVKPHTRNPRLHPKPNTPEWEILKPRYCDIIIQRWDNYTGKKAVKIDD